MDADDRSMLALADGEESALADLVARHQTRVWRIAARVLADPEEARDVAQQAFLKLLQHAAEYRPQGRFLGWLRTLVTRLCLEHLRRRLPEPREAPDDAPAAPAADPATLALEAAGRLELRAALLRLAPRQRLALVLRYDEGLGYDEIAAALGEGCCKKTVERLLDRGRKALSEALGPPGKERR